MEINLQELRQKAEAAVAEYLAAVGEPASIDLGNGFSVEIDRGEGSEQLAVLVAKQNSGYVRTRFVDDVVHAAIYSEDETALVPVQEISVSAYDLRGEE